MIQQLTAKYIIAETFKMAGRGVVFAGYIDEGIVSIGDIIEFNAFDMLRQRKIIGVEGLTISQSNKINTGLLIKCENEIEMDELRNWKPNNQVAIIYKSETPNPLHDLERI
ncbi:MAG: hypothetical protein ABI723_11335 [Bacteroidia bacterium]